MRMLGEYCQPAAVFCGFARILLMNTCEIYKWPQGYCKKVVDQTVSYYCKDHKDTEICKFEKRNQTAPTPAPPTIPPPVATVSATIEKIYKMDSSTTSGFPIFPLIGVAFGVILLVAIGISLFLFCRKQRSPSAGQKGPSKMEEGVSKTAPVQSQSKSVVGSAEKTGGDSKIEGNSKKSTIREASEKSQMTPQNDGRSAFMYTS
ncbi:hypothetical protein B9Z55_003164 [Caenorhabditis nigoni]|uniref:Uncharacterized protein n=2 Tax=Caenorhabditis nigoni TaxID=1611254 RepID=A0A2G5VPA1_9PELO|nr:hypothetical protein B9Z55_003164 [Caenorhabditis nigoni]